MVTLTKKKKKIQPSPRPERTDNLNLSGFVNAAEYFVEFRNGYFFFFMISRTDIDIRQRRSNIINAIDSDCSSDEFWRSESARLADIFEQPNRLNLSVCEVKIKMY